MKINEYIESGILEAYVLGSATEAEVKELLDLKVKHPQVKDALEKLETDLERIAQHMAITPPPGIWTKIEDNIKAVAKRPDSGESTLKIHSRGEESKEKPPKTGQFIEVQGASSHMRLHKVWRWIFGAVFVLGKIFLAFAIYYYLENRQIKQEIQQLKQEVNQLRHKVR